MHLPDESTEPHVITLTAEQIAESTPSTSPQVAAEAMALPPSAPEDQPAAVEPEPSVIGDGDRRIGRFTVAQLTAMAGKRGRKPPEFYQLFPKDGAAAGTAPAPTEEEGGGSGKAVRGRRPAALPKVSSAIIGEHTIDELLAMIGSTGRKPVAYDILHAAAEVFVERGQIEVPISDPLAAEVAAAPAALRELIAELLRQARA